MVYRSLGSVMRSCMLALLVGIASGCGGGGGTDPVPPAGGGVGGDGPTLVFAAAQNVAPRTLFALDLSVGLAELAVSALERGAPGWFGTLQACVSGSEMLRHVDTDNSDSMTVGDRVDATYTDCRLGPWFRNGLDGTLSVRVLSVDPEAVRAEVTLDPAGLQVGPLATLEPPIFLAGSFVVDARRNDLGVTVEVTASTADDLRREFREATGTIDRWRQPHIIRAVRHDLARVTLEARMRIDSDALGGSFEVDTPVPMYSGLSRYPLPLAGQGVLRMVGAAGATRQIRPVIDAPGVVEDALDLDGDGIEDGSPARLSWGNGTLGHLWRDLPPIGAGASDARFESFVVVPVFEQLDEVAVGDSLRVQFNTAPSPGQGLRFTLIDEGRLPQGTDGGAEIPVDVLQTGALVLIKPLAPLRYSNRYRVQVSSNRFGPGSANVTIGDDFGRSLNFERGLVGRFVTPDELRPAARVVDVIALLEPGRRLTVTAEDSIRLDRLARIEWQQLAGPPVTFEDAGAVRTDVLFTGSVPSTVPATVRMTATHLDGAQASVDVEFMVTSRLPTVDTTGFWLDKPAGSSLPQPFGMADRLAGTGGSLGTSTGFDLALGFASGAPLPAVGGGITLRLEPGQIPGPGRFEAPIEALETALYASPLTRPVFVLGTWSATSPAADSCVGGSAILDVHELDINEFRETVRASADLQITCAPGEPPATVSVRIRSSRPLPP